MVTTDIAVDPSNRAVYQAWNGSEGDYWTENAELYDASLARYDPFFFGAAAITPTDRVLDIGCGNGSTTCEAARRAPQGSALGVDLSARMIERARTRAAAAGLGNAEFLQADVQIYPFAPRSFDQVISRTGGMWFGDPITAFSNIAHCLRRSGRLTLLVWQDDAAFRFVRGIGFVKSLFDAVEESRRRQALDALRESLESHTVADGVLYPSAMWLIVGRRA